MANELVHKWTGAYGDGADGTKISESHVEAGHKFTGGANGQVLSRSTLAAEQTDGGHWLSPFETQTFRGLWLGTHPDQDLAAARVMLYTADEVIMDDGTRVAVSTPLTANLAAAGANGLDTGAEAASVWYEIYLIRKSSDGTLALLFHREKDHFLDEDTSAGSFDTAVRLRRATAPTQTLLAQGFKVDTTGLCPFVEVYLQVSISIVGRVWCEIYSDSAGNPNASLAVSDKVDGSKIAISANTHWVRFIFRSPVSLTATTQYHLVLNGDYTASDTNTCNWAADNTAPAYANGTLKGFDSSVWVDKVADAHFKVYITRNDTAVTMPATYDQRCLIGHNYNDGSSNLYPFVQKDRWHRFLNAIAFGTFTATIPTLSVAGATLPAGPSPVLLHLLGENNTVSARTLAAGVPDGFGAVIGNPPTAGGIVFGGALASGVPQGSMGAIYTEMQAMYLMVTSGTGRVWVLGYEW